jgi:acyl-coenzyme A synthetase/AMP-(fatty) acid ligase
VDCHVIIRGNEITFTSNSESLKEEGSIVEYIDMIGMNDIENVINQVKNTEKHSQEKLPYQHKDDLEVDERRAVAGVVDQGKKMRPSTSLQADDVAFILHSSGSTQAYPKAILIPVSYMLAALHGKVHLGVSMNDRCYVIAPLFHAYGALVLLGLLAHASTVILPAVKTWPPATGNIMENIESSNANVLFMLPAILEEMHLESQGRGDNSILETLCGVKAVFTAGAPLNEYVGDQLFSKGVNIVNALGSTETGVSLA